MSNDNPWQSNDAAQGSTSEPTAAAPAATTSSSAGATIYTLSGVSKIYDQSGKKVTALDKVDLTISKGDHIAIQGPTGGGKSTLLQMLGALDRPSHGSVMFDGQDLAKLGDSALATVRAQKIGFVFQNYNLVPTLTALENVEAALAPLGVKGDARRQRATEALNSVGLGDRLEHLPAELSGGQQQRVAIARAIVKEPSVLLADEPTGNLDETMRDEIIDVLEGLWREKGITLIVVTHDSQVATRMQRKLVIKNGRVA